MVFIVSGGLDSRFVGFLTKQVAFWGRQSPSCGGMFEGFWGVHRCRGSKDP